MDGRTPSAKANSISMLTMFYKTTLLSPYPVLTDPHSQNIESVSILQCYDGAAENIIGNRVL